MEGGREAHCGERLSDPGTEEGKDRTEEEPRVLGGGGARAERVPFIHPPAPRERRQTSEIAKKGRTHPCGTHPWPSDLGGLCSVSDISGVKPSQRMQAAATPLHLLVAEQTPALTFCLKSPLSPRRQQDVEGRYYQSGTPETWLILPPPLGIYSVAEGSQSTSARTRPCSARSSVCCR